MKYNRLRRIFSTHWLPAFVETLSQSSTWDNLGAVGRSNFGRITILVPLVGYLIIFNPSFVEFFQQSIPGEQGIAPDLVARLHSKRLAFLYFGLLLLGVGNLVFLVFSPAQYRQYSNVTSYINDMEQIASMSLVANKLDQTVSRFLAVNEGENASPMFHSSHPAFPSEPSSSLHDLIANTFADIPEKNKPEFDENKEPLGSLFEASPHTVYSGSGYLMTDQIMDMMVMGNRFGMTMVQSMHKAAWEHRRQVFFVEFMSLRFVAFGARLLVAFLFLCGFLLLTVPTLTTSYLVVLASL